MIRDTTTGNAGIEVLLLRRHSKTAFHGGAWVFPGGHIDSEDYAPGAPTDALAAARQAAVREAHEEAGLSLSKDNLLYFSHWTTPLVGPNAFPLGFLLSKPARRLFRSMARRSTLINGYARTRRWRHGRAGELELPPPTFVSLTKLAAFATVKDTLDSVYGGEPDIFLPKLEKVAGGYCSLYQGDAGYESAKVDEPGMRHRLWMLKSGWRYEQDQAE